jgi:hypothetical protein
MIKEAKSHVTEVNDAFACSGARLIMGVKPLPCIIAHSPTSNLSNMLKDYLYPLLLSLCALFSTFPSRNVQIESSRSPL